ncbi:MAG: choline kinase family protein [Ruminococcus sp.]|nr:choline kinase family protein [Ruminococcus sp.]
MREVLAIDIPKIKKLIFDVLGTENYTEICRMGGLTNHTYKVTMPDGNEYVVRIPGEGTEEMIVRSDELISTRLACDLRIDADLLCFNEDGSKIAKYIPNAITMSAELLHQDKHIKQVAEIFRKLHSCGVDTKVPFEVFEIAKGYEKIIADNNVAMFDDYADRKSEVMQIKSEIDSTIEIKKVPCHNDALCENWVEGDGKMYLIDWEYAGMNDGMWDIADVSIEAGFDEAYDEKLLSAYLGHAPTVSDKKHFLANKIYVDYLWTLWAKTRVPYDGKPMEDWAEERYSRLKGFIESYKKL